MSGNIKVSLHDAMGPSSSGLREILGEAATPYKPKSICPKSAFQNLSPSARNELVGLFAEDAKAATTDTFLSVLRATL